MRARALVLILLIALTASAQAQAQSHGEPRGVYSGAIHMDKESPARCVGKCRIRIVLSDDGREVTRASLLSGRFRSKDSCAGFSLNEHPYRYATIRDGRYDAYWSDDRGTGVSFAEGHFKGHLMVGGGQVSCGDVDPAGAYTFKLGLVGHAPASTNCDRVAGTTTLVLVTEREVGCHAAHLAARHIGACGPLAAPTLGEPAATVACGDHIELLSLRSCSQPGLRLFATATVPCDEVQALNLPPDTRIGAGDHGAFHCVGADVFTAEFSAWYSLRCDDPKDPHRTIVASGIGFFD